ncbi:METHIONINE AMINOPEPTIDASE 2 [Salix koriyanagi]|uniref:METHIONINE AMINOPEPTIDASE 2 n=1 Tax=Salix koriyanagi TaxID=2511006 RepID=A0A9Q0ZZJ9_9ROSI|nr:METHIONINE AMINOPEPTIDASE 2 [Salix koriyanagi]
MDLFPSGEFPEGEIQQYKDDNLWRITSEEKIALERLAKPMYNSVRQAAEVHRQYMKSTLKLGMLMTDPCDCISYWMLSELGCCSLDPKYRGREEIREAGEL